MPPLFSLCCLLPGSLHLGFPESTGFVHHHLPGDLSPGSPLPEKVLWWKTKQLSRALEKLSPAILDEVVRISMPLAPRPMPDYSQFLLFPSDSSRRISQALT